MTLMERSLAGAILAAIVILLRALLRRRLPQWFFVALWLVVAARMLLPIAVSLPLLPAALPSGTGVSVTQGGLSAATPASALPLAEGKSLSGILHSTLPWFHAVVASILAVRFAFVYILKWRQCKSGTPIHMSMPQKALNRRIHFRTTSDPAAPYAFGILRPYVLLPVTLSPSDTSLPYILAHETMHIRHFDTLKKALLLIAACIHWFNPLAWCMVFLANRDIEIACDEAVIRATGEDTRHAYAHTLLSLAASAPSVPLSFVSSFGMPPIEERIRSIMTYQKQSALAVVTALLLLLCIAAGSAATLTEAPYVSTPAAGVTTSVWENEDWFPSKGLPFGIERNTDGNPTYEGRYVVGIFDPETYATFEMSYHDPQGEPFVPENGIWLSATYENGELSGFYEIDRAEFENTPVPPPVMQNESIANLNIERFVEPGTAVAPGKPVTVRYTIRNIGKNQVRSLSIADAEFITEPLVLPLLAPGQTVELSYSHDMPMDNTSLLTHASLAYTYETPDGVTQEKTMKLDPAVTIEATAEESAQFNVERFIDPGKNAAPGSLVTIQYNFKNTGTVDLSNITIVDDAFLDAPVILPSLPVGESGELSYSAVMPKAPATLTTHGTIVYDYTLRGETVQSNTMQLEPPVAITSE